jgi:hypothetical protein
MSFCYKLVKVFSTICEKFYLFLVKTLFSLLLNKLTQNLCCVKYFVTILLKCHKICQIIFHQNQGIQRNQ